MSILYRVLEDADMAMRAMSAKAGLQCTHAGYV
jgi:hypothetical protein